MHPSSSHASDHEPSSPSPVRASPPSRTPLRALDTSAEETPPRFHGEIFDIELDGEPDPASKSQKIGLAWFFAGLAALFCTYNIGAYVGQKSKTPAPIGPFSAQTEKLPPLRVQLAGQVKKPGVYSLPGGARLEDAIKKAGGALPGADLSALNLADWAVDGSKIEIPSRQSARAVPTATPIVIVKEVFVTPPQNAPDENRSEAPQQLSASAPSAQLPAAQIEGSTRAKSPSTPKKSGKTSESALALLRRNPVDINRASAAQLAILPGVGPKMAERIIAYRQENGAFETITDLDNVKGIGEKRLTVLQPLIKFK